MVIYLDVIVFLNLFFNLMILSLTSYVVKVNLTVYRLLFGTLIATMLVPIVVYFPNSFFNSMIGKGLYSIFIIICCFGLKGIYETMKNVLFFYFISFVIGGGLFGLHYLAQDSLGIHANKILLSVNNIYGGEVSLFLLLLGFPLMWLFAKSRLDHHVKDKIKYDQMYECILTLNGKSHRTTGYIDSGNHLVDPLSSRPVVICDEKFLSKFFIEADWDLLRSAIMNDELTNIPSSIQTHIAIVPYQGVGGKSDFLYTIRPDKLTVFYEGNMIEAVHVLIGIQLADLTPDQRYHCLLHPQIIHFKSVKTA